MFIDIRVYEACFVVEKRNEGVKNDEFESV